MHDLKEKTKKQLNLSEDVAISRILENIFNYAVAEEIDEIIFESSSDIGSVKFYDAGEKKGGLVLSAQIKNPVFLSLKNLAGLKSKEKNQQGEFKKECLGNKVVFSASLYCLEKNEKIIISLNSEKFRVLSLGSLGLDKNSLVQVKNILEKKRGVVLVIGPFNSGRTSTIYSFVSHLNNPNLNITTFEREISYDLPEINQSHLGAHPGFRYPILLSSIFNQDPDIVMIDEIKNKDEAETVLNLAERGYFVLSGFFGQDFACSLDFFQGLGVSLPLFSSSVKMIVNQRLAFRNCSHCLEKIKLSDDLKKRIKKVFNSSLLLEKLKEQKFIPAQIKKIEEASFYRSRGCEACRKKRVSGKIGIFEILIINEQIKKFIKGGHFLRVKDEVANQGFFSLSESALIKALLGIISPEELFKIIEERSL